MSEIMDLSAASLLAASSNFVRAARHRGESEAVSVPGNPAVKTSRENPGNACKSRAQSSFHREPNPGSLSEALISLELKIEPVEITGSSALTIGKSDSLIAGKSGIWSVGA